MSMHMSMRVSIHVSIHVSTHVSVHMSMRTRGSCQNGRTHVLMFKNDNFGFSLRCLGNICECL